MLRAKRFIKDLARSFRLHQETTPSLMHWVAIVGVVAMSGFWLLRQLGFMPLRWDDTPFRFIGIGFCLVVAMRRWWPESMRRYYLHVSYVTVLYVTAFYLPLTLLENRAAPNTVANMMLGAMLVVLLTDWRNTLVMLAIGFTASITWFLTTEPAAKFPMEFLYWWAPLCLVMVAGGSAAKIVERRAELERLHRLYSGLAGSIAHEVRSPMGHVQHAFEVVQEIARSRPQSEPFTLRPEEVMRLQQAARQGMHSVRRGLQAVTLTLQHVKGKTPEPCSLKRLSAASCVNRAVDEYAYETAEQRFSVTVQVVEDFQFMGDETGCVLVLFNLLKNALYYLPVKPGASINVSVERKPTPRIVVRDTGPGVPADRLEDLFEEFHSFGKTEGSGLGLAFCRRVMTALGGDISCESVPNRYTEFTLTFPGIASGTVDEPLTMPAPLPEPELPVHFRGRTVLVVDDSSFNRTVAKARLGQLHLRVLEAPLGEAALRMLDEGPTPAAILMDMEMPGMSGIEATRALRSRPAAVNGIPVLALSANDLPSWREAALKAGMNGYLTKPLEPEQLRSELERVWSVTAHAREAAEVC